MTLQDLYSDMIENFVVLANANKIFYDHIDVQEGDELTPPYIVLRSEGINPFYADNVTYWMTTNNYIEVYTSDDSDALVQEINTFLISNEIAFARTSEYDNDIESYIVTYSLDLDED